MKKLIFLLIMMPVIAFVSCDDEVDNHPTEFVGTWELEYYILYDSNSNVPLEDIEYEKGNAPLLTLNANGSYEQINGYEKITGTWIGYVKDRKLILVENNTNEQTEFYVRLGLDAGTFRLDCYNGNRLTKSYYYVRY